MAGIHSPYLAEGGEHAPYLVTGGGAIGKEAVLEENLANEAVTGAKIATNSVPGGKLETGSVTAGKLAAPSAKPAKPAEGAVGSGAVSAAKKRAFSITGNGVKKEFKLAHNMETRLFVFSIQTATGEEPGPMEPLLATFVEVKAINATEVEVIFVTAPAAGKLLYITLVG